MKTLKIALVMLLVAATAVVFDSCQKAKLNRTTTSSADNSLAEAAFTDVYKVAVETADDESSNKANIYSFGNCANVTVDPAWPDTTFPKSVIVDFGSINCTCNDGKTRRGIISFTMTGRYRTPGTVITLTTDNYYVEDYKVEGLKTITNQGRNNAGNLSYSIAVQDGKITTPDAEEIKWESSRVREWIEGEGTTLVSDGVAGVLDDVYSITGSGSGVNRDGRNFTVTITSALIVKVGCRWITQGVLEIAPEDLKVRKLNYGDGNCDNEATVEIGNKTYNIMLR
ncbi:MAG: hypothetical protein ABIJ16_13490 [Bacteroidota bacterium]